MTATATTPAEIRALVTAENIEVDQGVDLLDTNDVFIEDISADVSEPEAERQCHAAIHGTLRLVISRELDWPNVRLRPWQKITGAGYERTWTKGIYLPLTPDREVGDNPMTFRVTAYDKMSLLAGHEIGDTYQVAAGVGYLDAVRAAITAAGHTGLTPFFDGFAEATNLATTMVWMLDPSESSDYLAVCNDLLHGINYRDLWVDDEGRFRSEPWVDPATAGSVWTFDTGDLATQMVGPRRKLTRDQFSRVNHYRFIQRGKATGGVPTEGAGFYTKAASPGYYAHGATKTVDGLYTVHAFTAAGANTFVLSGVPVSVEYLVVGGGGAGGTWCGAGGGGGGVLAGTETLTAGTYAITVGAGAARGIANAQGANGSASVFNGHTAPGGGGGGWYKDAGWAGTGSNGGCGGGGSWHASAAGGTGSPGYNGGAAHSVNGHGAGGGGGMGAVGAVGTLANGGAGGVGVASDILVTGVNVYYGGGGGGFGETTAAAGGNGGGGAGATDNSSTEEAVNGTANRGGGGGGGWYHENSSHGGGGGSGVVILRYLTPTGVYKHTEPMDVPDQAALVAAGDAWVAKATQKQGTIDITTSPAPFLTHLDVVDYIDIEAGGTFKCQVVGWRNPLKGEDSTVTLEIITEPSS